MKTLMSYMKVIKKMSMLDISIYKLTVYAFALGLATLVPWFNTINPWIYVAIGAVLVVPLMIKTYRHRKDSKGYFATALANFHEYSVWDAASFEIGITLIGLALYQLIPVLQTVNPVRYLSVFLFGLGWITAMWVHQK